MYQKNAIKQGQQHFLKEVQLHSQISGAIVWAKFAILMLHKLGRGNNPYLAQRITPRNGEFCVQGFSKCAKIPNFTVFVEHQSNFAPKLGPIQR